ncbi:TonB-dependent receptor [Taibaiella lutea]|uniref:TonB-dependent receptor n=1 Tax=Taibaiella lutea TaxID=2608001 RepID=A0A5M6CUC6_9BACT|nr:TonB-dependent receptor [Taibaiella lutea]KAA5536605.1 TonB-dependent receptor [Taibaiella lutea]
MNALPKTTLIIVLFSLFHCCANPLFAQQRNDTLKEVEIRTTLIKDTAIDKKSDFSATQSFQTIGREYKDLYESQSLANLLSQQTSVFIKSYGVNSMATLSLRGASAAQSAVLWNGVPIMNPALGVADLSLLQTGLFSDITLKYGSSAALYGSGNVGGALLLDNQYPDFTAKKNIGITAGVGSYGSQNLGLNTSFQNEKWTVHLNGFYQKATNDISYKDESGNNKRLENAALQGGGALLSVDYNLKEKWNAQNNERIYGKLWWQTYDREIPPAMFESFSDKQQKDASLRTLLGYEKNTRRSTFYVKGSYNKESLHYEDSAVSLDNRNNVHQVYQETGFKYRLNNPDKQMRETWMKPAVHQVLIFVPMQFALAEGNNISSNETQFRPAIAAAYSFEGMQSRLKANASFRQEWVNGTTAPLLPGAGVSFALLNDKKVNKKENSSLISLLIRGNVQRTYRIPTLNELYYFPGGNPDLKPEQGWSQDAGYTFQFKHNYNDKKAFLFLHELNGFNRNIQDWIYWLGGAIWTPHNIAKVHSRGIETNNRISYSAGQFKFNLGLNYTYVLSTTEASYLPGDGSIGKQIPYTPRYNAQGNFGIQWKGNLFVNWNQTYTGYRFVTVDESQYLDPYFTANIQVSYAILLSKYKLQMIGQLQNIFNTDYQVVNARPMPGRNFSLQLRMGIY